MRGSSLSIPVTLRMVIIKSRERASVLREQEIRAQQQQQQQMQQQESNDLYSFHMGASDQAMDSTISSFLSQQLISSFRQNSGAASLETMAAAMQQQQQQQAQAGDVKLSHAQHLAPGSLAAAQKALIQNLQSQQSHAATPQQQQQQQQMLQRHLQQQGLVRSLSNGASAQQAKQNAMLLNMVRTVKEE